MLILVSQYIIGLAITWGVPYTLKDSCCSDIQLLPGGPHICAFYPNVTHSVWPRQQAAEYHNEQGCLYRGFQIMAALALADLYNPNTFTKS